MVKEIRWSVKADRERLDILEYWVNRNKSVSYSIKLSKLFVEKTKQLSKYPELGIPTKHLLIRIKVVEAYLIYYEINPDHIKILTIWDSRRDPNKLKL
ncbi:MAG TPA: type II toxin-antitoxin system RelE/ParE family toxin [Mucilaginibacter sp.]|jgi:plasmid stabilization system protein ParE|nr:type II toxin-antitoxin system RelE/ParE family toxin [Mucilaginibacter sp.]